MAATAAALPEPLKKALENEEDRIRDKFKGLFDAAAEGDGTSSMLAIYQLIAEGRNHTLKQALQDHWQPRDKTKKPWGMVLVQPKNSDQWIWASEAGAQRLREVGMQALDPTADVNREYVQTGPTTTVTDLVTGVVKGPAAAMCKCAGIDLVGIKDKCIGYGVPPEAVMAVVKSPGFVEILLAAAGGDRGRAEGLGKDLLASQGKQLAAQSGLTNDQIEALQTLCLSGGTDWSGLDTLKQQALEHSGALAGKALWVAAKLARRLKVAAIERRAETACGLRHGDVEAVFTAAAGSPLFKGVVEALINGGDGMDKPTALKKVASGLQEEALTALVDGAADETGLTPEQVEMVLCALVTGDFNKLQPVAATAKAEERGLRLLWALLERFRIVPVDRFERAAKRWGLRAPDVEVAIVVTLGEAPTMLTALWRAAQGDRSALEEMATDVERSAAALAAARAAARTALPPSAVMALVRAVATGDVALLEEAAQAAAPSSSSSSAAAAVVSPRSRGLMARLQVVTGDAGREAEAFRLAMEAQGKVLTMTVERERLAMAAREELHAVQLQATVERERLAAQLAMQRDKAHLVASLTAGVASAEDALAVLASVRAVLQEGPP